MSEAYVLVAREVMVCWGEMGEYRDQYPDGYRLQ